MEFWHELSIPSMDAHWPVTSDDVLMLEPVDDQLLLQDTDDLLATITKKKIPMSGAQRRDLYRQRQKNKREGLKEQIASLTQQVEALRREDGSNELALFMTNRSTSTWRLIAMKEKQNRICSETQQKKVRTAVANQAALIVDLQHIVYKRLRRVRSESCDFLLSLTEKRPRFGPTDGVLLDSFLGELNIVYRETDEVMNSCGSGTGGAFTCVKRSNGEVAYFEMSDTIQLPFAYQRACDLIWEVVSLPHRQMERILYNSPMAGKNEFAVNFHVVCPQEFDEDVIVTTHFVARRYFEDARVVVVWRGLMEGDGDFTDIRMEETGWCVGYPVSNGACQAPATLVQKYARVLPLHFGSPQAKVDEFSKLILCSLREVDATIAALIAKLAQCGSDPVIMLNS